MANRVTLYTRINRTDKPAQNKIYAAGTTFFLRYQTKGKRVRETLPPGTSYQQGLYAARSLELELFARNAANYDHSTPITKLKDPPPFRMPEAEPEPVAPVVTTPIPGNNTGLMLDAAIDLYLENARKRSDKPDTAYKCNNNLSAFYRTIGNKMVKKIVAQDLINYVAKMRSPMWGKKHNHVLGARTIHNRLVGVGSLLSASGCKDVAAMVKKTQVKYVERLVRAYRPDELAAMFKVANEEEWILAQFLLCLGPRISEVRTARWQQVDFVDKIFTIDGNHSKDKQSKEIPIPNHLLTALKKRMLTTRGDLIFPSPTGKVDYHLIRHIKALGKKAGLTGTVGCHVFRRTFATALHRSGVDARTVQTMLGHSDIAVTLRYLAAEDPRSERARAAANSTFEVYA
jgi:integrase